MKIYIDDDYKCHALNDGTMREIETEFFNGKCLEYIEGYRFLPEGESWTRDDGEVFTGEMVAPWVEYSILQLAQLSYLESIINQILEVYDDGDTTEPVADENQA